MTVPEKIAAFLHGGKPGACDDCIRAGLKLPRRQEVAIVTLTLSLCAGFQKASGGCASRIHAGANEKLVIRAL